MKLATKRTAKPDTRENAAGFSDEEKAAMKERVRELRGANTGEDVVLAKIAELREPDRSLAERLHALVRRVAPGLVPKTWYGMPAYANADGQVVCFFQSGQKFKTRYATLGFSDKANLDDGSMWPTAFALQDLTGKEEARITALLKQATS